MSRLPDLFRQIVDTTGEPILDGALLHTYESNTTNNLTTYSDSALTTANTNPLVANSAGVVGPIYMQSGTAYTFVEATSADVTLRTENGVYSVQTTESSTATRQAQYATNPLDYQNSVGDGVADEYLAVQDAIDAVSGNGVVDLLGLTFRCDTQLILTTGVTLRNGTLDFSSCTDDASIQIHGSIGSPNVLTGDAAVEDLLLSLTSVSGLAAENILNVTSSDTFTDSITRGELVEIRSFSTLDANLEAPIRDAYATASSAAVTLVSTLDDVKLEDLVILAGSGDSVSMVACRRARMKNVRIDGGSPAVLIEGCYDVVMESCSLQDTGLTVAGPSQFITIRDNVFEGAAAPILVGGTNTGSRPSGIPRDINILNNSIFYDGASAGGDIDVTPDAQFVRVNGNTLHLGDATAAINVGCLDSEVCDNVMNTNVTDASVGIRMLLDVPTRARAGSYVHVVGNKFSGGDAGIDVDGTLTGTITDFLIADNVFNQSVGSIAFQNDTFAITNLIVRNNLCSNTIFIDSTVSTGIITNCLVSGNRASQITLDGNNTTDTIVNAVMRSNISTGTIAVNRGITNLNMLGDRADSLVITDVPKVVINGVELIGGTGITATLNVVNDNIEFTTCAIANCVINPAASDTAITVSASDATRSSNLAITGCVLAGVSGAIDAMTIDGLIDGLNITGNLVDRDDDAGDCISVTGDAAAGITNGYISGNTFINGAYAIEGSNISGVYAGHNLFKGQGTAAWTGLSNNPPYRTAGITTKTLPLSWEALRSSDFGPLNNTDTEDSGKHYAQASGDAAVLYGNSPNSDTQTDVSYIDFRLPEDFDADQATFTFRVRGSVTTNGDTQTVDIEAYVVDATGAVGADMCSTAAQNLTDSNAAYDFTITPGAQSSIPGALYRFKITTVFEDNDGAIGEALLTYFGITYTFTDTWIQES
jgi:hypothetical protein